MRKVIIAVNGMDSSGYQTIAEHRLSMIDGVCKVKAAPQSGEIVLYVTQNSFDLLQVFAALREVGFSFAGSLSSYEI